MLIKSIQKKRGDFKFLYANSSFLIISFIIGARLTYVVANARYYMYDLPQIFALWDKGLSFWGGLILTLAGLFFKTRVHKESFNKWMDYLAEPFLYALPIAYIGKFFDGMGYGAKTDLPLGIAFKNMDVAIISPVHPTQLYGAVLMTIGILITRTYFKKYPEHTKIPGYKATWIIAVIAIAASRPSASTTVYVPSPSSYHRPMSRVAVAPTKAVLT